MSPIATLLAITLAAATAQPPTMTWSLTEQLETRYQTHAVFTPEQIAKGWVPSWKATVAEEDGATVLTIGGDEKGTATGYFYVGRRIKLPQRIPSTATVRLAYQCECSCKNRAPGLTLYVVTPRGWDALSQAAAHAKAKAPFIPGTQLVSARIVSGRDDILAWTDWQSPNLSPALRRERGREVIVAFGMAGMHAGGIEWAKFKTPELIMSQAKIELVARTAQYPPKEHRTLHSDEQVALARQRIQQDRSAQSIRDSLVASCKFWMDKTDDEIRSFIPGADVPRAFNVSTFGCPIHGKKIYKHGCYPWKVEIDNPFQIKCPIGGETFPSNDFWAYYRGGCKDTSLLKGKYVDDGWGWVGPNGETYWLVAYACHWYWNRYLLPATRNLSRAYLLTGDPKYAHKAAVMLDRIADIYPSMQYENQSRYGALTGGRYLGKIINHIWETGTGRTLSEAYDNIFDALADNGPLEGKLGKPCKDIRNSIEANILEEIVRCVQDGHIAGNFGMHQCALAMAAVVREKGPTQELMSWMLRQPGKGSHTHEGVEYAFYNFIYKDGMPFETSPGYCFSWLGNFVSLAPVLEKAGYDFYANPKFKAMFDAFLDLVCIGKFTPAIGDAGSITSKWIGASIPVYLAGFAHYHDVRYAHALAKLSAFASKGFKSYDSLFEPDVLAEAKELAEQQPAPTPRSRVLDGYGCGILNNDNDSVAVSIYFGYRGGHSHDDRLNFSLFAYGHKMIPDLGYPDFMNSFVPGIFSWSSNTVSHNCVVVNQQKQRGNVPGQVQALLDAPGVRFIDVTADGTYEETTAYRRALVLVDIGPNAAYLLDLSTVTGGEQHDYSIHGPLGEFTMVDGQLTPPAKGTLAGEDVPYAYFYDDARFAAPNYRGGYGGYHGSGFQHLENVQQLSPGKWWAQWRLDGADDVGLRMRILDQPGQQIFVTDGRVSPTGKHPWVLKYLIARRKGKDLASRYVTLLEPFKREPTITDAERLDVTGSDDAYAIKITRRDRVDVIVYQTEPKAITVPAAGLETDGTLCVLRLEADGGLDSLTLLNGTYARTPHQQVQTQPAYTGTIQAVDYAERAVRLETDRELPTDATLVGRPVFFSNDQHRCLYTIRSVSRGADGFVVALDEPEIMTGKAQIKAVDEAEKQIATDSTFAFARIYNGMRAVNEAKTVSIPVASVGRGVIRLAAPIQAADFTDANRDGALDAWLCDFGPGDAFRIDSVAAVAAFGQ